jgi:hypothetical protein
MGSARVIYLNHIAGSPGIGDDPSWDAGYDGIIGHIASDDRVCPDRDVGADPHCSNDLRARPHVHTISYDRDSHAGASIGLSQSDSLRNVAVSSDSTVTVHNDPPEMADIESRADLGCARDRDAVLDRIMALDKPEHRREKSDGGPLVARPGGQAKPECIVESGRLHNAPAESSETRFAANRETSPNTYSRTKVERV